MTTPVSRESAPESRVGGWAFIVGGALLFGSLLMIALLPSPPPHAPALIEWINDNAVQISISNEFMFFAVVVLLPALAVLARALGKSSTVGALFGCTSLFLALGLLGTMVIVQGRLVYPVFGIELGEQAMMLAVSTLYGGLHAVQLLLGIGVIAVGIGMLRQPAELWLPALSFAAGAVQFAGAFPWLTPVWVNVAASVLLVAWTVAIGLRLLSSQSEGRAALASGADHARIPPTPPAS